MDTTLQQVSNAVKAIPEIYGELDDLGAEIAAIKHDLEIIKERLDQVPEPEPIPIPEPEPPQTDNIVLNCTNDGSVVVNSAIIQAMAAAVTKKVAVIIPKGLYWIKPGLKITASLIGVEATFVTKETSVYNVMVQTVGSNLTIYGITFDQRQDAPMLPDSKNYKGLHIIHIPDGNDITVDNCTFYGCGVTSILSNPFDGFGYNLAVENNKFIWERKINSYFDVSIINADGVNIYVANNVIEVTKNAAVDDWWAETGVEFHCCSGRVKENIISHCVNGMIKLAYPSLYRIYDPNLQGETLVYSNQIQYVCRGIVSWNTLNDLPIVTSDTQIYDNTILLYLDRRGKSYYYPSVGIGLVDGGRDNSEFINITIVDNDIKTGYKDGLNPRTLLNYGPIANSLGGIYLMTRNSCKFIEILRNDISFPFTAIQCRAVGDNLHQSIFIEDNIFTDCAIYRGYLSEGFDAIYNFENVNGATVHGNLIFGNYIKARHDGKNVTNIDYNQS